MAGNGINGSFIDRVFITGAKVPVKRSLELTLDIRGMKLSGKFVIVQALLIKLSWAWIFDQEWNVK